MTRDIAKHVYKLERMYESGLTNAEVIEELFLEMHNGVQRIKAAGLLAALPQCLQEALNPLVESVVLTREETSCIIEAYRKVGPWKWSLACPWFLTVLIRFTTWMELSGEEWWEEASTAEVRVAT